MPTYTQQLATKVRKDPLGPVTLNQLHENVKAVDASFLHEHFAAGGHNAVEVPWILGHVNAATTGYLFDTAYGGTTIARPAVGRLTVSAVSGVVGTTTGVAGTVVPVASILANVSDAAIATSPHVVEAEMVSTTSVELRTRYLTTTVGTVGNAWAAVAVSTDVAVHAQKQAVPPSALASNLLKVRRDFLTEQATDWNALVSNQGILRKALTVEHVPDLTLTTFVGDHLVNRIAKASGIFIPTSATTYSAQTSKGVGAVTWISTGVVEVTLNEYTLSSVDLAACFCQAQQDGVDELVIVNGRCTTTAKFRFYIYAYSVSENKWSVANRSFYASMFGRPA